MVLAMNSTVMSGTPRTNSMKITENMRMIGSRDRRPSARMTPSGSENTMPTVETTMVTRMPPQSEVGTCSIPSQLEPLRRMKARMGKTTKK